MSSVFSPVPVAQTELAVLIAFGVVLPVFMPEELEGDVLPFQLRMRGSRRTACSAFPHPRGMVEGKSRFSREASSRSSGRGQDRPAFVCPVQIFLDGGSANTAAFCRLSRRQAACPSRDARSPLSFSSITSYSPLTLLAVFGRSVPWHLCDFIQRVFQALPGVAGFIITGGRFGSYSVAALGRNTQ